MMNYSSVSSKVVWNLRVAAGKASVYVQPIDRLQAGERVVLWLRVSHRQNKVHLRHQERVLRNAVKLAGGVIAGVRRHVGPGYELEYPRRDYWSALRRAADFAAKSDASLLATETDRYVRNPYYRSNDKELVSLQARDTDLMDLRLYTEPVRLLTLTHPDANAAEAKSAQVKRTNCGRRQKPTTDKLRALHESGLSPRVIEAKTGMPASTVRRWLGLR